MILLGGNNTTSDDIARWQSGNLTRTALRQRILKSTRTVLQALKHAVCRSVPSVMRRNVIADKEIISQSSLFGQTSDCFRNPVCVTITPFACGCNESNYPNNTDRLVNVFVAARVPRISEGNLNVFRRLI